MINRITGKLPQSARVQATVAVQREIPSVSRLPRNRREKFGNRSLGRDLQPPVEARGCLASDHRRSQCRRRRARHDNSDANHRPTQQNRSEHPAERPRLHADARARSRLCRLLSRRVRIGQRDSRQPGQLAIDGSDNKVSIWRNHCARPVHPSGGHAKPQPASAIQEVLAASSLYRNFKTPYNFNSGLPSERATMHQASDPANHSTSNWLSRSSSESC